MWLPGGVVKPEVTCGAKDRFVYHAANDGVHVQHLHATFLNFMGIEHQRFKCRVKGLGLGLTAVEPARFVTNLIA